MKYEDHEDKEFIMVDRAVDCEYSVDREELTYLMRIGYKRKELAHHFGVSLRTIARAINKFNMKRVNIWSTCNDAELDGIVRDTTRRNPTWGEKMVEGSLVSRGILIPRQRLRDSLQRVDQRGREQRRRTLLRRRQYSVAGPNALWHLDGNHKLIRWLFVIHGCIDGYSRVITFLRCSSNNSAQTVLDGFRQGVAEFGLPERVRSDMGRENMDVCTYMLQRRGTDTRCFITGKSVHNQRVERLWKDLFMNCTSKFYHAFYQMEDDGILDVTDEVDMFCLHYVFLPLLNYHISMFREAWMNHRIRTEGNHTPEQLWRQAVLQGYPVHNVAQDDEDDNAGNGINQQGVEVPPIQMPLNENDAEELRHEFEIHPDTFRSVDEMAAFYRAVRSFVMQKV